MPHTWDRGDLERRLCHALSIGHQALERLGTNGYCDANQPEEYIGPAKVIGETAMLLLAAWHADSAGPLRAKVNALAAQLAPLARGRRMLLGMCLQPALALEHALGHLCLARMGYPDQRFDAVFDATLCATAAKGRERLPHRVLEQEWLLRMCGRAPARLTPALPHAADVLAGTHDDVYGFTHAVIFARDFGIDPQPLARSRSLILAEAEAMLARCLDEGDYDLSGELLWTWPLMRARWTPAATFGFRVLARVEDLAGFLPSAGTSLDRLRELAGEERKQYLVATAYHTVYVMGLLCAAALRPQQAPPVRIVDPLMPAGAADRVLPFLDDSGPKAYWWEEFQKLSGPERDALAGLLLHIALRRRAIRRDFEGVARLIRLADELRLEDSPLVVQAAEMLHRLMLCRQKSEPVLPFSAKPESSVRLCGAGC